MKLEALKVVSVVHHIRCDRCGKETECGEVGFEQMTSIGLDAGYGSIFGDENRVGVDLCETCVRDTLGIWLRVKTSGDIPYARMHPAFKSKTGGGEIPVGRAKG